MIFNQIMRSNVRRLLPKVQHKKSLQIVMAAVLMFTSFAANVRAQQFDYEHNPRLNFTYKHLALNVNVNPVKVTIDGQATYDLQANISGPEKIQMHAAHMDISGVKIDGEKAKFMASNDTLTIQLGSPVSQGQQLQVAIQYNATPNFGMLKDRMGTVWSSRLTKSNAHWFPVKDHPRVTFTTDITMKVPGGYSVVGPGTSQNEDVVSVDQLQGEWKSDIPIAASDVSFAVGKFDKKQTGYGVKNISLYSEKNLLSDEREKQLLQSAYEDLKNVEQTLKFEYPYSGFNVVVLPDHHWETKNYGASTAFLYANDGNLEAQLKRAVYAQWFGTYQREEQWIDSHAIHLYQTWLQYQIDGHGQEGLKSEDQPQKEEPSIYDIFGIKHWNDWQKFYGSWNNEHLKSAMNRLTPGIIQQGPGVYNWDDYARIWYQETGQPWFDIPDVRRPEQPDSIIYTVDYHFQEQNGNLKFVFTAKDSAYNELVTIPMTETLGNRVINRDVTFTGRKDSVMVKVNPAISNVNLTPGDHPMLHLIQHKPKMFWVYQLRNSEDPQLRREAALGLGNYATDPDLQLAINGVLNDEQDPEVKAALYSTMAKIMNGATGTEQTFLDALRSDNKSIQEAAIGALQHYPGNEQVLSAVKRKALDFKVPDISGKAIKVYHSLADSSKFLQFAEDYINRDTTYTNTVLILKQLAASGQHKETAQLSARFINSNYPYRLRSEAIKLLTAYESDSQRWIKTEKKLLTDLDPRIRYFAVKGLRSVPGSEREELLNQQMMDEYDLRVLKKMNAILKENNNGD